jgi:putative phosphoesterase|tara:strand:+ start:68 stop:532 length:465 start_codon:yes stop_codon:yes gene_type:complete
MEIGIISDTHGHVPNAVHDVFASVDHILHAGDVGPTDVITELETIAPVSAVLGNTDYAIQLPQTQAKVFVGTKFLVHHIVDLPTPSQMVRKVIANEQPNVVVFGHTHMPCNEQHNGVLFLNPGSASNPRGDSAPSVVVVNCNEAVFNVKFVALT